MLGFIDATSAQAQCIAAGGDPDYCAFQVQQAQNDPNDPWANTVPGSTSFDPSQYNVVTVTAHPTPTPATTPVLAQGASAMQQGCSTDPNCVGASDATGNWNWTCNDLTDSPQYVNSPCYVAGISATKAQWAAEGAGSGATPASGTVTPSGQVVTQPTPSTAPGLSFGAKLKADWKWILLGVGAVAIGAGFIMANRQRPTNAFGRRRSRRRR